MRSGAGFVRWGGEGGGEAAATSAAAAAPPDTTPRSLSLDAVHPMIEGLRLRGVGTWLGLPGGGRVHGRTPNVVTSGVSNFPAAGIY